MRRHFAASAVVLAASLIAGTAEARCVQHIGVASDRDIAKSSAMALDAWVKDASKRSADAANWSKAKNMEVLCKKVIAGSGPRRGPRWVCDATGSSSDVPGGEPCPK